MNATNNSSYEITIQRAIKSRSIPTNIELKKWAAAALSTRTATAELTIRIVDEREITELNATYRKKNKPTNVLSFPFDMPFDIENELPFLGDIIICADVITKEAREQKKPLRAHWAHMVVHGTLHLLGYDHEKEEEATVMEAKEIHILNTLGFANPYQTTMDIQ